MAGSGEGVLVAAALCKGRRVKHYNSDHIIIKTDSTMFISAQLNKSSAHSAENGQVRTRMVAFSASNLSIPFV
jgi:hypothetical protein